jgi:hypothetical protein
MMRNAGYITALALSCIMLVPTTTRAVAQSSDACSPYVNAVEGGSASSVPIVPDRLLTNWATAIPCLVQIVGGVKDSVTSPNPSPEIRSKLLSATGAIRAIMTTLSAADEKAKSGSDPNAPRQDTLNEFINLFRTLDNLDVISVLTYGMRSDSYDMRLNSVLILGNVIDNSTICVPLIQVYDKRGEKESSYVNGRANLLAVISVVAPWAYRENYDNIQRTKDFVQRKVGTDASIPTTGKILVNIDQRLKSQVGDTNKNVQLSPEIKSNCAAYMKRFLPNADLVENIKY